MSQNAVTKKITDFIKEIGIEVVETSLDEQTFLPGILIERGKILFDKAKLEFPGDLLHEAGHLAVAPADIRSSLSGEVTIPGADMQAVEAHATAWAYAAIIHLDLDPKVLFHDGGYQGRSEQLIFTYGIGCYLGANGLEAAGMTVNIADCRLNLAPYPKMIKWLRD